jgi:plasmid stabilization system protein ParE
VTSRTKLLVTKQAKESIREIGRYLRREATPAISNKVTLAFAKCFDELLISPLAYRIDLRFGLGTQAVRSRPLCNYLVIYFYDANDDAVVIVHVIHGASDLPSSA